MTSDKKLPVFLLIDTSTTACSVALTEGVGVVTSVAEPEAQGRHAELAGSMVEQVLETMRTEGLTLDAVVVSAGPGSYTGLRIGSSLAKGLAQGYGVPLIAVSTLEMMADGYRDLFGGDIGYIHPMIDARRMEVYTASFDPEGVRLTEDQPVVLSSECHIAGIQEGLHHFVGNGASKVEGLWADVKVVVAPHYYPEAHQMAWRAIAAWEQGQYVDLAYWTPNYLKEYVATIGRNKVLG